MKLLLYSSIVLGFRALAAPLQKPLGAGQVQEKVEELSWTDEHCMPTISSAGNDTMCLQAVYNEVADPTRDPVNDPDITGATQYCGYVKFNNNKTKLFFWLVMTQSGDPKTQPVVLWMNGGPGVSSMLGLWDQWGPRLFDHTQPKGVVAFRNNEDKMTEKMSWIFLDQPAGVGFSKTTGTAITDSNAAARDIRSFIDGILMAKFNYKGSPISLGGAPLHIAGESFAGHYIPALGSLVCNDSPRKKTWNLQSLIVGNGLVDVSLVGPGLNDMECKPSPEIDLGSPVLLSTKCAAQPNAMIDCSKALQCKSSKSAGACDTAFHTCEPTWGWKWAAEFNRDPWDGDKARSVYKKEVDYWENEMKTFLNKPERKIRFGVDSSTTWQWSNDDAIPAFQHSGDWFKSYIPEIGNVLNGGIDFMLYVGEKDLLVPVATTKRVANLVDWNEVDIPTTNLKRDKWRKCAAKDESLYSTISALPGPVVSPPYANYVRAGRFNYVRMFGSGHMINENHPTEAKHLFETWVFKRDNFAECTP